MVPIEELFDALYGQSRRNAVTLTWERYEHVPVIGVSLLPAVSVVVTGVVLGILMGRHDNRAEERYDP